MMINAHRKDIKSISKPKIKFNLKMKMIFLISLLIVGIFIIFGLFLRSFISTTTEDQMGKRALSVAQTVANMPEIKEAFLLDDPASVIQEVVKPIQQDTAAEYIVVGNREGIRYSHPEPNHLGKKMVGGDNERALTKGESYISKKVGSLGLSIRGKVPIYDGNDEIIGLVSVGFLNEDIQSIIKEQSKSLWFTLFCIVLLGITGAIIISYYIKRLLSNMEPEEISDLLLQKEAILESTHEGMIAVNKQGLITMMNAAAKRILFGKGSVERHYIGRSITELIPHTDIFAVLAHGENQYNREMVLGDHIVLVNRMPIIREKSIVGAVSTFRKKTEIEHVTKELSQIKQYANAQRAQTHEFSNKLYTILGLLQLNQGQKAIEFIKKEKHIQLEWSQFLLEHVADPMVQGLLQGKFNQANELGITMSLDPGSQLSYRFTGDKQDALLTGLGNLLENAMEAVKGIEDVDPEIAIFFTDIGEDIVIEIDDSGPGISSEHIVYIFDQGFSTKKNPNRGTGLALCQHMLHKIGGALMLEEGELGGACFVMTIPKNGGQQHE
ncbi:ATP-binding protein [Virgibacillus halotolerans]|uniref:ATP-binding protein n=1 Tax=Virgibacillus halotolerans TaxID=1071053 RepID=UPI001EF98A3E|nr:sensor histidine kinase [Virgibacillus halotolerans]